MVMIVVRDAIVALLEHFHAVLHVVVHGVTMVERSHMLMPEHVVRVGDIVMVVHDHPQVLMLAPAGVIR
jgi:hypothetical protein